MSHELALLSSTRWDPLLASLQWNVRRDAYLLLDYHVDRMRQAAEEHAWSLAKSVLTYTALKEVCDKAVKQFNLNDSYRTSNGEQHQSFKMRILLKEDGNLSAAATLIPPLAADPTLASSSYPRTAFAPSIAPGLTLCLDMQSTPTSIFTRTKTTHRAHYDAARIRFSASPDRDVLLYNPSGQISETTIHNVAFWRRETWVTPSETTGCLPGVMRRWLLEQGIVVEADEGELTKDMVYNDEVVLVFNGVQGCRLAKLLISS